MNHTHRQTVPRTSNKHSDKLLFCWRHWHDDVVMNCEGSRALWVCESTDRALLWLEALARRSPNQRLHSHQWVIISHSSTSPAAFHARCLLLDDSRRNSVSLTYYYYYDPLLTVAFPGHEARDDGVWGWHRHQLDHMQTICTSLQAENHTNTSNTSSLNFYRSDALPDSQRAVSKQ